MASNTRERILETSRVLFNEYGFQQVTMRRIADELKISPGNLTYYFQHKEDISRALMDQSFEQTYLAIPIEAMSDLMDQFRRMLETLQRNAFFFLDDGFTSANRHSDTIHKHLAVGLRQLTERGVFSARFTPELQHTVLRMLLMTHPTWLRQSVRGEGGLSIDEFLQLHYSVLSAYFA